MNLDAEYICWCCRFEHCTRILDTSKHTVKDEPKLPRKRPHHALDATSVSSTAVAEGRGSSPYPLVDQFITKQLNKEGVQGVIRRYTFFPQGMFLFIFDNS